MPFYHQQTRAELRQRYADAWRKRRDHLPSEPLELQIGDVVQDHPEYHPLLERSGADESDYTPELGATNPFLHMGLHLALRDQIATDRPPGIRGAFEALAARRSTPHDAEHALIEVLAETLLDAQRSGLPPDEARYLERIRGL